ncbi:MAG TPA: hypothetical protein VHY58_15960 [Streptosporangiaceae bacterium]|jgi:hypothetical protein|nr:hypothetical protein [Streptosporangiaceae bacterium]
MTDGATLTRLYLDRVERSRARAGELLGPLQTTEDPLLTAFYRGRYLSRPLFIGRDELDQCYADTERVRAALVSLPGRLYGDDLAAFARGVGEAGYPVRALLRGRTGRVSAMGRADLYACESGFKLLEYNMGSALTGLENADLCRALLEHPLLRGFAAEHQLGYTDSMREQVASLLTEAGLDGIGVAGAAPDGGRRPMVVVTDWPTSFAGPLGGYMRRLAARWTELGLDATACHAGELEAHGGRVWLRGRAVDVIARMFIGDSLLDPAAPALIEPVLDAVARGEVAMFTPLDSEIFGAKAALAMLSDERNRHLFSAAELASFDRILPWTRMLRPGPVTLEDGRQPDLLDYAARQAGDLVIKPTGSCGGEGVTLGWDPAVSPEQWRAALTAAVATPGSHVIQRRVRPVPELFPDENGEMVPWTITWGVFTGARGYAGIYARGLPSAHADEVVNLGHGAFAGSCLAPLPG